jgi:hypothetical protein
MGTEYGYRVWVQSMSTAVIEGGGGVLATVGASPYIDIGAGTGWERRRNEKHRET